MRGAFFQSMALKTASVALRGLGVSWGYGGYGSWNGLDVAGCVLPWITGRGAEDWMWFTGITDPPPPGWQAIDHHHVTLFLKNQAFLFRKCRSLSSSKNYTILILVFQDLSAEILWLGATLKQFLKTFGRQTWNTLKGWTWLYIKVEEGMVPPSLELEKIKELGLQAKPHGFPIH